MSGDNIVWGTFSAIFGYLEDVAEGAFSFLQSTAAILE